MRITLARGEFLEALSVAARALSNRSTLPVLTGILLSADEGRVTLNSTDLEVSIRTSVNADVSEPGQCVVPGKLLADIVRSLPEAAVTLATEKDGGSVSCGSAVFHLRMLAAEEFPRFPEVSPDKVITLSSNVLSSAVRQVSRAVSRDETRPILTGILLVVEGATVRMVATDSYRLAVREEVVEKVPGEDVEVVIPGRAMEEAARMAPEGHEISIGVAENQVVFSAGNTVFVTRRIEGTFPNYRQLTQQQTATVVTLATEELMASVKRVSLLAQHNAPIRISVDPGQKTLSITAQTQDVGDANEDMPAEAEGESVEIAFNHAFLADGIAAVGTETLTVKFSSPLKPGIIESSPEESFLYLLMPVRL